MSTRPDRLVLAGAAGFAVTAAAVAATALIDDPAPADVRLLRLTLPAVIALPGALGLLGRRQRPSLLVAGMVLGVALSALSFVLLPMVIFALLYAPAAARGWTGSARPLRAAAAIALTVVLGLGAAASAALVRQERCWRSPTGVTATCGQEVTPAGAGGGLALAGLALVAGGLLARPQRPAAESGRQPVSTADAGDG